jgi:tetratricopeptide (TPR) repeat protein
VAARAAWRLQDWGAVQLEMEKVRELAHQHGERVVEALALTALGEAMLKREGDAAGARVLIDDALEILAGEHDPVAHFDVLMARATIANWLSDMDDFVRYLERAYVMALDAGRKDLQTIAAQSLATRHIVHLELDEAELLLTRALELAGESGSVRARVGATLSYGWFLTVKGELDAAETVVEEVRATALELGNEPALANALMKLGWIARLRGDHRAAEKHLREAMRITASRGDRGLLPDYQAVLAATLADLGKVDEAERLALEARANAVPEDMACVIVATTALGAVRAAQGRDAEAEELFAEALAEAEANSFNVFALEALERFAAFLRDRGREDDAASYEARLAELTPPSPPPSASAARIA